jgi:hypothetical protein
MHTEFIEVTIRSDSTESIRAPTRKGRIRVDQIASHRTTESLCDGHIRCSNSQSGAFHADSIPRTLS